MESSRRTAEVAKILYNSGKTVIVSLITPLDEMRLVLGSIKAGVKPGKTKARKRRARTSKRESPIMPKESMPKDRDEIPGERVLWGVESERSLRVTKDLVNESSSMGQEIFDTLQLWVEEKYGNGMRTRMVLRAYINNMPRHE